MLGSILGAGLKLGGSIFGGIKTSKAMKNVRNNINNQLKDNQDWYDQKYNEDATQRADAQRALTMTEDAIRKRNQQAAGQQAVMGGTEESTAAAKAANNEALANTTSAIAAAGEQQKDKVEQEYLNEKNNLNKELDNSTMKSAEEISKAAQGVGDAASSLSFLE